MADLKGVMWFKRKQYQNIDLKENNLIHMKCIHLLKSGFFSPFNPKNCQPKEINIAHPGNQSMVI